MPSVAPSPPRPTFLGNRERPTLHSAHHCGFIAVRYLCCKFFCPPRLFPAWQCFAGWSASVAVCTTTRCAPLLTCIYPRPGVGLMEILSFQLSLAFLATKRDDRATTTAKCNPPECSRVPSSPQSGRTNRGEKRIFPRIGNRQRVPSLFLYRLSSFRSPRFLSFGVRLDPQLGRFEIFLCSGKCGVPVETFRGDRATWTFSGSYWKVWWKVTYQRWSFLSVWRNHHFVLINRKSFRDFPRFHTLPNSFHANF